MARHFWPELIPRHFLSYDDHLHILCFIDAVPADNDPCRNEMQEPLAVLNRCIVYLDKQEGVSSRNRNNHLHYLENTDIVKHLSK